MFWVKSAIISLFYFFAYLAFTFSGTEEVPNTRSAGHVVDNFAIEELVSSNSPSPRQADLNDLKIKSTWLYEKGTGITPPGSTGRNYGKEFFRNDSRFVCWEITLEHPSYVDDRDLNFTFTLVTNEGRRLTENKADSWIPANTELSDHSACWGWPYPNNWKLGNYYFEVKPDTGSTSTQIEDFPAKIAFQVL